MMGDYRGFLNVKRERTEYRPVCERVKDYKRVFEMRPDKVTEDQSSRCMDCGTPFCHSGCPVGNYIPEWNDLVFKKQWKQALSLLIATNNLPEITGRVCPALCEYSCVLGINDEAVTIRENELGIIEYGFKKGLIAPRPPKKRTDKKVAVIGSGPAGLSCADQLNKKGHLVTVFEKDQKIGGITRYGIPDFKLEKWIIDRRLDILKSEGIDFKTCVNVGVDYSAQKLLKGFDAICLAGGCRTPRDLKTEGRDLKGIHFAMDYLIQSNKRLSQEKIGDKEIIDAKDKRVVVIGGGDTGADCVGTALRQKAKSVVQIELLPKPAECRTTDFPWPKYPVILKTSSSHEEGCVREWAVLTKKFLGRDKKVTGLSCIRVDFSQKDQKGCPVMKEIPGSDFLLEADLVILALGFTNPQRNGLLEELNVELDNRGNVKTAYNHQTSVKKVFSAGDMRRGQSLIVWAIYEGRQCAYFMDQYLC